MRVLPCGDGAVLLDCADLGEAQRHHAALVDQPEVLEAVLGARTVLLRGEPTRLAALVRRTPPAVSVSPPDARTHVVEVVYGGGADTDDLAEVARLTGLTPEEVIAAHTGTDWTVAFGGFAPGFAYLVGGDAALAVPRKKTPRPAVPAGAVGLAGDFTGVYPRESPGGWQLIGRTDIVLFDVDRSPAALLAPGDTVRFRSQEPPVTAERGREAS